MGNNPIIKVEGVSKHYMLNKSISLKSDTLFDSFMKGLKNLKAYTPNKKKEEFWALKDVSFDIQQGDRVGIIGRNGAGKSTLLKILSRITPPTKGKIEYFGRMASLLEVGTGFHGDLSGRENIYLNGSILGMNKHELDRKFDEIVAFAEIEKFLDTPVKRYSSGMYVRLAFAVAAHLEPDILIVDEVLAVGDAAFQKKCLGKMEDVSSKEGRTILFVSHQMGAVQKLCNKGILLQKGVLIESGEINSVVKNYLSFGNAMLNSTFSFPFKETNAAQTVRVELYSSNGELSPEVVIGENWKVKVSIQAGTTLQNIVTAVGIVSSGDLPIVTSWSRPETLKEGQNAITFSVDDLYLTPGIYKIVIGLSRGNEVLDYNDNNIYFNVSDVVRMEGGDRIVNTKSGILVNQMNYKIE
jgi:lipopolysaccharide transport system ATP-binding protein